MEVWLSGVFFSLQDLTDIDSLPPTWDLSLWWSSFCFRFLKDQLEMSDCTNVWFPIKPQIKYLQPKSFHIKDETRLLNSPADITPLALATVGMEILSEEKTLTKMLQKSSASCRFNPFVHAMSEENPHQQDSKGLSIKKVSKKIILLRLDEELTTVLIEFLCCLTRRCTWCCPNVQCFYKSIVNLKILKQSLKTLKEPFPYHK